MFHVLVAAALTITPASGFEEPNAPQSGWVELFDGKSLKGWTVTGGRRRC